ncbi:transcriptional adaptor 2 [Meredithblackwellia eburnea MCA 4105]
MTVTKRKKANTDGGNGSNGGQGEMSLLGGNKFSCDFCAADVTHTVRIRCAETVTVHLHSTKRSTDNDDDDTRPTPTTTREKLTCPDFDLCVTCFLAGKYTGPHKPTHAYRVISSHSFPIFARDWGADEELLLIEGAEMYGLGNWADTADHVGGRTKEECEQHYRDIYLSSVEYPLPVTKSNEELGVTQEEFQTEKKQRLEDLQHRPFVNPPPKPLASAPTCHEIGGFMPGRLEFETEYENEAETLIKDMEFGKVLSRYGGGEQPAAAVVVPPRAAETEKKEDGEDEEEEGEGGEGEKEEEGESETELDLKMTVLDIFNERYDRRVASKDLIFDRGLVNYKLLLAAERKRSKEERDLIQRTKVFARIQTGDDHEKFVDGLLYELALRKRIAELQEYRRNGITSLSEGERYDLAKSQRLSAKQASYRDSLSMSYDRGASRVPRVSLSSTLPGSGVGLSGGPSKPSRSSTSTTPLTLATSSSLHLLTPLEQTLCSTLRILPRPYLFLKETLLREFTRLGGVMGSSDARRVAAAGAGEGTEWAEKVDRVWEFLCDSGGLRGGRGAGEEESDDYDEEEYDEEGEGDDEDEGEEEGGGGGEGVQPMEGVEGSVVPPPDVAVMGDKEKVQTVVISP